MKYVKEMEDSKSKLGDEKSSKTTTIVIIIVDSGLKYKETIFNKNWIEENEFRDRGITESIKNFYLI